MAKTQKPKEVVVETSGAELVGKLVIAAIQYQQNLTSDEVKHKKVLDNGSEGLLAFLSGFGCAFLFAGLPEDDVRKISKSAMDILYPMWSSLTGKK